MADCSGDDEEADPDVEVVAHDVRQVAQLHGTHLVTVVAVPSVEPGQPVHIDGGVRQVAFDDVGDLAGERRLARSVWADDQDCVRALERRHLRSVRSISWLVR